MEGDVIWGWIPKSKLHLNSLVNCSDLYRQSIINLLAIILLIMQDRFGNHSAEIWLDQTVKWG